MELTHFNKAKNELALATSVDEIKTIRGKAEALRAYAKQAGESLEMQNQCAEIKIRAERRAGEIIPEKIEHGGDRRSESRLHDETLKDLDITRTQSHRWQAIASVPEEAFEEHIAQTKAGGKELTSVGVYKLAKKEERRVYFNELKNTVKPIPDGLYSVILADPPWRYEFSETDSRAIENQYPPMDLDAIKEIKIPATENSILFLWATAPKLEEALSVLNAWGFKYRTCSVWDKEIIGMGYWFRGQHELLLVGVRGNFKTPEASERVSSVYRERRTKHSKKPEYYYDLIEKYFPNGNYLELFARQKHRQKWEVWGNEC